MLRRECLHAVECEEAWKGIGRSAQSVPSLSNTAMRSARDEVRRALFGNVRHEVDDGLLGRAVVPRRKRVGGLRKSVVVKASTDERGGEKCLSVCGVRGCGPHTRLRRDAALCLLSQRQCA